MASIINLCGLPTVKISMPHIKIIHIKIRCEQCGGRFKHAFRCIVCHKMTCRNTLCSNTVMMYNMEICNACAEPMIVFAKINGIKNWYIKDFIKETIS